MLTLEEHRRLHGEIAHEQVLTIRRWAGFQTRAEVDAQADQLIAELGEPLVDDRADPRRVVVAWPDRSVYARVCCPVLDLWKPYPEARADLEASWAWGDPKRKQVTQLDADQHAEDPHQGESPTCVHPWHENPALIVPCPECGESPEEEEPAERVEVPVQPVLGPGPYGPLEEPTDDQVSLVEAIAANVRRDLRILLQGLITLKPNSAASGKTCKQCAEEIHAGGVQANDDPPEFWHRDCAAELLTSMEAEDEADPSPAAAPTALTGGQEPAAACPGELQLNPVLIDRARGAWAGKPYTAKHNPERLRRGQPIGDPQCFACWKPIKRGDLAGRATKSSKKPMHWTCVEQVIERVGAASAEEAA